MIGFPMDRSAAFTALLELTPWFGKTESGEAGVMVTRFLAAFYASGETDMAVYARRYWAAGPPACPPDWTVTTEGLVTTYEGPNWIVTRKAGRP